MIYRRFTEKSAEEWRQIYKALQLLEFLIKHGSERVIDDARSHLTLLKMLRQFHFIDQNGKDQGVNVRNRAKELADLLSDSQPAVITPARILQKTSEMFDFSIEEIQGKSRRRPLVTARQIGMYVFREMTDYSYPKIAEEFGGRDHTTVMHACEKIRGQMAERRVVFEQVNELINRIKHGSSG